MTTIDWNARYEVGDLPWDSGVPEPWLVTHVIGERSGVTVGRHLLPSAGVGMPSRSGATHVIASEARGRALDVGCGTGTNALWLARRGFDVLGVDVSARAIAQAHAKRGDEPLSCRFEVFDFLGAELDEPAFDLVFDRGCFHVFDEAADRARFAERVAAALAPTGEWLSLIGSTEGPPREEGPPRRTLRDLADAIEPHLAIVEIRAIPFSAQEPERAAGWLCRARRRSVPAQPSTRR